MDYVVFNVEKLGAESVEKLKAELESHRMTCRNTENEGILRVHIPRRIAEKMTVEVFARLVAKASNAGCVVSYKDKKVHVEVAPKELLSMGNTVEEETEDTIEENVEEEITEIAE